MGRADDVVGANVELQQPLADMENNAVSDFSRRHRRGARPLVDGDKNWNAEKEKLGPPGNNGHG